MTLSTPRTGRLLRGLVAAASAVLGLVLVLAGFALAIGALLVGLMLSAGLILWARATGRRPSVHFGRRPAAGPGRFQGAIRPRRPPADDVIDVPAREVPARDPRAG
ncbi:hypothetical protein [Piscinibacter sp.]|uniref:hypothetical protein n=1 Tax=Piscinibacter sp. TaxID=1903157 RepID=UPI002C4EC938|nr:hypothetical protein [Albitalea sp.]HUG25346.1 hypothetical protein [Albitalea sp.]